MEEVSLLQMVVPRRLEEEREVLEEYLGIVQKIQSPWNLFLRLSDLLDPDRNFVYFFVYSFGERKAVLWGMYSKLDQKFTIQGSCKYMTRQLGVMVHYWKEAEESFLYTQNLVVDRFTDRITFMAALGEPMSYAEYLQTKYILAYLEGKIDKEDLPLEHQQALQDFYDAWNQAIQEVYLLEDIDEEEEFQKYVEELRHKTLEKEARINREDFSPTLKSRVGILGLRMAQKIGARFFEKVKTGKYSSFSFLESLPDCPDLKFCENEIFPSESCQVYFHGQPELGLIEEEPYSLM